MSDFYSQVAEQNPEITDALKRQAELANVNLSLEVIHFLVSAVIRVAIWGRANLTDHICDERDC